MSRFCAGVAAAAHEQRASSRGVPSTGTACQRPWALALRLGDCERGLHASLRAPPGSSQLKGEAPGKPGAAGAPAAPVADPCRQHAELLEDLAQHLKSASELGCAFRSTIFPSGRHRLGTEPAAAQRRP